MEIVEFRIPQDLQKKRNGFWSHANLGPDHLELTIFKIVPGKIFLVICNLCF